MYKLTDCKKSCVQAGGLQNSCVRADERSEKSWVRVDGRSKKSCVRAEEMQKACGRKSSRVGVWKNGGVEIITNSQRNRMCQDADMKPIVRDPMDDDTILVESGAEMTLVPHEPSEFEKLKHHLTHIPFQPWCTSCMRQRHKRNHTSEQGASSKTANSQQHNVTISC